MGHKVFNYRKFIFKEFIFQPFIPFVCYIILFLISVKAQWVDLITFFSSKMYTEHF